MQTAYPTGFVLLRRQSPQKVRFVRQRCLLSAVLNDIDHPSRWIADKMYRAPDDNYFWTRTKPDVFGLTYPVDHLLLERTIQKYLQAMSSTAESNPAFSVEVHGPAPAVIQIKPGTPPPCIPVFISRSVMERQRNGVEYLNPIRSIVHPTVPVLGSDGCGGQAEEAAQRAAAKAFDEFPVRPVLFTYSFSSPSFILQGLSPKPGTQCQPAGFYLISRVRLFL